MTITVDRSWAVLVAIAIAACLLVYWQAKAIEASPRALPGDLGLQLEDVGVGVGDEGDLTRP
jgi:hypothetical protein